MSQNKKIKYISPTKGKSKYDFEFVKNEFENMDTNYFHQKMNM